LPKPPNAAGVEEGAAAEAGAPKREGVVAKPPAPPGFTPPKVEVEDAPNAGIEKPELPKAGVEEGFPPAPPLPPNMVPFHYSIR
jgi:hypothetical protein